MVQTTRGAGLSLAMFSLSVLLGACGSELQREDITSSFSESFPDATSEQSECVADRLVDRYGIDQLEQELSAPEPDPAFEEAQFRDMFACGMDGDVRTQLESQLVDSGVDEANAPCVADSLSNDLTDEDLDVLLSGEITEEFYEKFFDAMDGCDAIN